MKDACDMTLDEQVMGQSGVHIQLAWRLHRAQGLEKLEEFNTSRNG
jgi:hypothetical protein